MKRTAIDEIDSRKTDQRQLASGHHSKPDCVYIDALTECTLSEMGTGKAADDNEE